ENWNGIGVARTDGACAEFVRVPATSAFQLPSDMPRNWGALVEPLSCAVHGLDQVDVEVAGDYLIYGAGTMGLLLAQLAKDAGAGQIDIVDTNSGRHPLATRPGADHRAPTAVALDRPHAWAVRIDPPGAVPAIEDALNRAWRGGPSSSSGLAT